MASLILRLSARSAALPCHAFGDLAVVVGAAGGAVVADLGDGGHVDGVVELAVAAPGEPVDLAVAGGRLDRGGAVVGGEVVAGGESVDVADVAEHGRGDDGADAVDLGDRGRRAGDGAGSAPSDLAALRIDPATNQVTTTISLGRCCDTIRGVAVGDSDPCGPPMTGGNGVIARIDLNTLAVTALIPSVQPSPSKITIFDKQVWIGHDAQFLEIEAIDPTTNQTSAAVHVEDFAGSVAGGAGTVWTNCYNAMKVFRMSPR